jgi:hypothetical protein
MANIYDAPDILTETAVRQAGETQEAFVQFTSIRSLPGSANAAFSFGTHASRPASGLTGDGYFETDRGWLYYYSGTAWLYESGVNVGTNATRAAITVTANDNGALFFTNDQNKLWRVEGGAWVDRFVTLDLTTSLKIGGTKVVGAQGAAVADVASADATDLATVLTLANETKAQLNALLARVRASGGHGLIA